MALTKIEMLINKYDHAVSFHDTESKGTNLEGKHKVETNLAGNTNGTPVPWYYDFGSNANFDKHHIKVHAHDQTYYIWQHKDTVYYAVKKPPKGYYTDGEVLRDKVGGRVALKMHQNGDLSMETVAWGSGDRDKYKNKATKKALEFAEFIEAVVDALKLFQADEGIPIIQAMQQELTHGSFNGTNYVQQVLATESFSSIGPNHTIGPTVSVAVGVDVGFGVTVSESVGVAARPLDSDPQVVGIAGCGISSGASAGIDANFQIGFWTDAPKDLEGIAYGVVGGFTFDVGVAVGVFLEKSLDLAGLTVSFSSGEEVKLATELDFTGVID